MEDESLVRVVQDTKTGLFLAVNQFDNLCDTCDFCPATCGAIDITYGEGVGNDNVIACDAYTE